MTPLIAIVGRPNVGKSQLFNRFAGTRIAVVEDLPGTTRDRLYASCDIWGRRIEVVDTGGLDPHEKEGYAPAILGQAQLAIEAADIIIFLTDARQEPSTLDFEVADLLRRTRKPVILAGNKVDNPKMPLSNLYALRLGDPMPISALTGHGVGDLADRIHDLLPPEEPEPEIADNSIKVALVGRPNVGKSSLTNRVLGYERSIVSPVPGTTRDAVDTKLSWKGRDVTLIDTAGMRRRSRVKRDSTSVEYHMVLRALRAVDRADVAVIVLEAGGVTDQDTKIAGYAHEAGKAVLICVNKWDIVEEERERKSLAQKDFEGDLGRYLPFVSYAPIHFTSAQTGAGVEEMFDDALEISKSLLERIPTGPLNDLLQREMADRPPPSNKGKPIKIRYATQIETSPPTILLFANDPEGVHFGYVRHLQNVIRAKYPFRGVPMKVELRGGSGARGREERLEEKRQKALVEDMKAMQEKHDERRRLAALALSGEEDFDTTPQESPRAVTSDKRAPARPPKIVRPPLRSGGKVAPRARALNANAPGTEKPTEEAAPKTGGKATAKAPLTKPAARRAATGGAPKRGVARNTVPRTQGPAKKVKTGADTAAKSTGNHKRKPPPKVNRSGPAKSGSAPARSDSDLA